MLFSKVTNKMEQFLNFKFSVEEKAKFIWDENKKKQ